MNTHKDRQLLGFQKKTKYNPAHYFDSTVAHYAEIIATDLNIIIKKYVIPEFYKKEGLKQRELRILSCLEFYKMALTPADIASLLRYDPATVTRAVNRLKETGLITRKSYKEDSRSVLLQLTKKGESLASRYTESVKNAFETLEDTLETSLNSEEKEIFLQALVKLHDRSMKIRHNSKYLHSLSKME